MQSGQMRGKQILDMLFGREPLTAYRRDKRFRCGTTDTLAKAIRAEIAAHPDVDEWDIIDSAMSKVYAEWLDIIALPEGPTRARIVHMRMDAAIARGKIKNAKEFATVACTAKCSGCCHTNISITSDEAELLADHVRAGMPIDREKMARQAAVGEMDFPAWKELSYEQRGCVFLAEDGDCRVYQDRPGVCRKWFAPKPHAPKECSNLDFQGLFLYVNEAEIINSALFNIEWNRTGRLAKKVQDAL